MVRRAQLALEVLEARDVPSASSYDPAAMGPQPTEPAPTQPAPPPPPSTGPAAPLGNPYTPG